MMGWYQRLLGCSFLMKRGVDGRWVRERKKERRRKAESNNETDETSQEKVFRSKISFIFIFYF